MIQLFTFPGQNSDINLRAEFSNTANLFKVCFELSKTKNMSEPPATENFKSRKLLRKDNIWKKTCYEVFWSEPGKSNYWELNYSAKGEWNIYQFESYRVLQPPKPSLDFAVVEINSSPTKMACQFKTKLDFTSLELSFCSIIKTLKQETLCFSSDHGKNNLSDKPDFHLRKSFSNLRKIK